MLFLNGALKRQSAAVKVQSSGAKTLLDLLLKPDNGTPLSVSGANAGIITIKLLLRDKRRGYV